jgi:hypothetical protein
MNYCPDQYSHSSVKFRTNGMLQKKPPVVLMFLLFASLVLLAGCSNDSNSAGPSMGAPIGPGGATNSIEGIQ